jgi:hypothetical protein
MSEKDGCYEVHLCARRVLHPFEWICGASAGLRHCAGNSKHRHPQSPRFQERTRGACGCGPGGHDVIDQQYPHSDGPEAAGSKCPLYVVFSFSNGKTYLRSGWTHSGQGMLEEWDANETDQSPPQKGRLVEWIGGISCLIRGEASGSDRRRPPCVPLLSC